MYWDLNKMQRSIQFHFHQSRCGHDFTSIHKNSTAVSAAFGPLIFLTQILNVNILQLNNYCDRNQT